MRTLGGLLSALLAAALAGCGPGAEGGGDSSGDSVPPTYSAPPYDPVPPTFQVPSAACPGGWIGLTVTTDSEAEVEYLDDMPACTNAAGDMTYLENGSDAVWILRSTSSSSGTATAIDPVLRESSFVAAVASAHPGEVVLVPGAKLTVDLAPEEVEWVVDLPLSFGWQGHDVLVDKLLGTGEAAAVAALRRQSPAGAALAVCSLAVTKYAETVAGLEEADAPEVLLTGLGVGVAGSQCRHEAASVTSVDESGRVLTLADDIERLRGQTEVLGKIHGRLGNAQRLSTLLRHGLKFLT